MTTSATPEIMAPKAAPDAAGEGPGRYAGELCREQRQHRTPRRVSHGIFVRACLLDPDAVVEDDGGEDDASEVGVALFVRVGVELW